jgi:hypothetical protein
MVENSDDDDMTPDERLTWLRDRVRMISLDQYCRNDIMGLIRRLLSTKDRLMFLIALFCRELK